MQANLDDIMDSLARAKARIGAHMFLKESNPDYIKLNADEIEKAQKARNAICRPEPPT